MYGATLGRRRAWLAQSPISYAEAGRFATPTAPFGESIRLT